MATVAQFTGTRFRQLSDSKSYFLLFEMVELVRAFGRNYLFISFNIFFADPFQFIFDIQVPFVSFDIARYQPGIPATYKIQQDVLFVHNWAQKDDNFQKINQKPYPRSEHGFKRKY